MYSTLTPIVTLYSKHLQNWITTHVPDFVVDKSTRFIQVTFVTFFIFNGSFTRIKTLQTKVYQVLSFPSAHHPKLSTKTACLFENVLRIFFHLFNTRKWQNETPFARANFSKKWGSRVALAETTPVHFCCFAVKQVNPVRSRVYIHTSGNKAKTGTLL